LIAQRIQYVLVNRTGQIALDVGLAVNQLLHCSLEVEDLVLFIKFVLLVVLDVVLVEVFGGVGGTVAAQVVVNQGVDEFLVGFVVRVAHSAALLLRVLQGFVVFHLGFGLDEVPCQPAATQLYFTQPVVDHLGDVVVRVGAVLAE